MILNSDPATEPDYPVAKQYWGIYRGRTGTATALEITENEVIYYYPYTNTTKTEKSRYAAWTAENELWNMGNINNWLDYPPTDSTELTEFKLGHFETNQLIVTAGDAAGDAGGIIYTKE